MQPYISIEVMYGYQFHRIDIRESESVEEVTDRIIASNPIVIEYLPWEEKEKMIAQLQNEIYTKIMQQIQLKNRAMSHPGSLGISSNLNSMVLPRSATSHRYEIRDGNDSENLSDESQKDNY